MWVFSDRLCVIANRGGPIVASAFRPALAIAALRELLPARWGVSSRIELWCFVGQAIAAAGELHETVELNFTATSSMWEIYSLPRFRDSASRRQVFQTWTALCAGSDNQRQRGLNFPTAKPAADLRQLIVKQVTPTTQPEDLPELQAKLGNLNLGALQQRALDVGVSPSKIQAALSSENFSASMLDPQMIETQTMATFVGKCTRNLPAACDL